MTMEKSIAVSQAGRRGFESLRDGRSRDSSLKQLEDENRRLKGLVADLTLDKQILQDVLSKKL